MRKTSSLLLALGLFSATAATAQGTLSDSLIAYYPFTHGSMADSSGNNRVLTNMGAIPAMDANGVDSNAYYFNGDSSSFMQMSASAGIDFTGDFSICMKVKPMGYFMGPCHGNVLLQKSENSAREHSVTMAFDDNYYTGGMNCFTSVVDTLHQNFYIVKTHQGSAYTTYNVATGPFATSGQWSALVMTQRGDTLYQYVDGLLVNSVYGLSYTSANSNDIFLGKTDNVTNTYNFKGVMDEIRFYKRALADSEAKAYYAYRQGGALAVKGVEAAATITLSPNPATDVLRLTNPSSQSLSFRVLSLQGVEVVRGTAKAGDTEIPVSQLASGMYLLQVQEGKATMQTLRFVKQ